MRRRIEIVTFERERVVGRETPAGCPVCRAPGALLTTRQAAALLQVSEQSIRRWLADARAHGVKTPGGRHRVCRNSLFLAVDSAPTGSPTPNNLAVRDARAIYSTEKENSDETQTGQ